MHLLATMRSFAPTTISYKTGKGEDLPNNEISGFTYDSKGRLIDEPAHDNLSALHYAFTPESQLTRITSDSLPGATVQAAMYEGGDHRWFRSVWGDGSKALITLRDASGQVVADYAESNASSGLKLQREYVHANGQLVAINSACGPRPALNLSNPHTVGTTVWFDKTDYIPPVGSYTIHVRTSDGQAKTIMMPSSIGNHFSIGQNELFPNVQNWIQIEAQAACGSTGYSNAVSYIYDPTSPSCLKSTGGARANFNGSGSKLLVRSQGSCAANWTYNVYYVDPDAEATELAPLNGSTPVADPSQLLDNIPCGSGNGNYWVRPVSSVTHHETAGSPIMTMDGTSCGGGLDASSAFVPGQPSMNVLYVHWDHLGSSRLITDEHGVSTGAFKYYPFGYEAEFAGGSEVRQKFTGHERDEGVGLDYMMARSCRMTLARFLEPDSYSGSMRPALPQSWNRYAYVLNSPINATDPEGYVEDNGLDSIKDEKGEVTVEAETPAQRPKQPDNATKQALMQVARAWFFGGKAGGVPALKAAIAAVTPSAPADVFGFGSLSWAPPVPSPVRPAGEAMALGGYSSSGGWYLGHVGAAGVEVGGQQNYGAGFTGYETTTSSPTPTAINLKEGSIGVGIPWLAGLSVGAGRYNTANEHGWFFFVAGGAIGEHGGLGFGFSTGTTP